MNRAGKDCVTVSEEDSKPLIDESLCIGCGMCIKKCQRDAIMVVNLPEELRENPIHRYGRNMFSLFRLPVPKQNAVVGLIGPNGTGKSTVLNILSGILKPNTGLLDEDVPWQDIIDRFKGTELQAYMESLSGGQDKKSLSGKSYAYKPQHVDLIPRQWSGKVRDLLEKSDQTGRLDDVVSNLGIGEMLGKKIRELSGGELQLLAIAATILRKADFYFFDEPSSYLDAQQRLVAAREIRRLCSEAIVMVIEHDLAVADYLADYTHILYGKPGAFGIVSKPYGVRVGINTYLDGYIKEDNVRFRPESITFSQRAKPPEKDKLFLSFQGFGKSFEGFSLKTEPGNLYRGEVIGIIGPNGIGKTTFINMLAGKIKPNKGEPLEEIKLSLKPQRLVLKSGEEAMTVQEFLSLSGSISSTGNKRMLRILRLDKLLERKLKNLSGGELQSCFIAASLMQEHELLLLDEPSAFLDVEQRLRVARLIREHAEGREIPCFVVDHDLQFIDAISDRTMVFSGERGVKGHAAAPCPLADGMNSFLKALGVTYRRDPQTGRPRANKPDSQKDVEQRDSGNFYYAG